MIYFDNAATSWPKPPCVNQAVLDAIEKAGNPGRGSHSAALWSAYKVYETREKLAGLFHIADPLRIAFTMNATHALNIAVNLCYGEIVTTAMDHNSVLRPCVARGFYHIVEADSKGNLPAEKIIRSISDVTGAVVMTHASNVTGTLYDIAAVGESCRQHGVLFIVDASQTAGVVDIDVEKMNIDVLCFTGHKGLYGLQGTGGIYIAPKVPIRPYMSGGTGSKSFELTQPTDMPDCFEAGTVNTHGILSLGAGVDYVQSIGVKAIFEKEAMLRAYFLQEIRKVPGVIVYGDPEQPAVGVVSIGFRRTDCGKVCALLARNGICTRAGAHCAPLAHRAIGTTKNGTVRFSFGYNNTKEEIDETIRVLLQNRKEF